MNVKLKRLILYMTTYRKQKNIYVIRNMDTGDWYTLTCNHAVLHIQCTENQVRIIKKLNYKNGTVLVGNVVKWNTRCRLSTDNHLSNSDGHSWIDWPCVKLWYHASLWKGTYYQLCHLHVWHTVLDHQMIHLCTSCHTTEMAHDIKSYHSL